MADYPVSNKSRVSNNGVLKGRLASDSDNHNTAIERQIHLDIDLSNLSRELHELLVSKHKDYGPKNISQAPGGAINGLRVRMHDKLARINNLVDSGAPPEHESLEDSFKDMANYAIIGLLVLRNKWDNE